MPPCAITFADAHICYTFMTVNGGDSGERAKKSSVFFLLFSVIISLTRLALMVTVCECLCVCIEKLRKAGRIINELIDKCGCLL